MDVLEEGWEGEERVERGQDGDIEDDDDSFELLMLMLLYEQSMKKRIGHGWQCNIRPIERCSKSKSLSN